METILLEPLISEAQVKAMEGLYISETHYHRVINTDCDVYWNDNGVKKLLLHYRRRLIPNHIISTALAFKKEAKISSSMRGIAGGIADASKMSGNIERPLSAGKFRSKVVRKDGTVSDYYRSNKVNSMIAGYFDKPKLRSKHEVIATGAVPCRTTAFTEKHSEEWESVVPLIELADHHYKIMEPEVHLAQQTLASKTSKFQIGNTAFSTLTANLNWRTACHIDAGDYKQGYSVVMVVEEGKWSGGYLGFPRFGVCVDLRQGDFLLIDPHQYHANTEIIPLDIDYTRLSLVLYYREGMGKCKDLTVVPITKGSLNLKVYIREDTTDIKVIEEVLLRKVYEQQGLAIEGSDRWLDLGGNIGTFAMLVMSRGAYVTSYEPEITNANLLTVNLNSNFPDRPFTVHQCAVSTINDEAVNLYICKGDYNKYRHTMVPVRGRQVVKVPNVHIVDVLKSKQFNAIKMDIEGAEIPILELLTPDDWRNFGIEKLVFEYSFDVDKSIPRFNRIIDILKQAYHKVIFTKVKQDEDEYKYYPAMTIVYCYAPLTNRSSITP
jgi:FkbM family methyltransferase